MYISAGIFIILFLISPAIALDLLALYLCYLFPTVCIPIFLILLIIVACNN